ncbi:Squalene epoxidase [Borealophlyctis nickersoniae]|nr:Squalene epoxidase [Borealophlyctis nickersoniae]
MVLTDCELPYQNRGHVVLGKPSPILLYQIGTHDTRILVDIPGKLPSIGNGDLQRYMQDHIGPQLPKSVQPSFYASLKTSRLRSMPNSWLPPSTNTREGLILIGDAMNMRHPLTGGGMTVAFWDVVHICDLLSKKEIRDLADSNAVLRQMKVLHWRRKPLSSVINILAQALYDLFSAGDDVNMRNLQMACFGYFKLGGKCVTTPMGLIAGMIPEPMTLTGHFFAVAFYGCWLIIKSQPLWMLPQTLFRSFMAIYTAAVVIFPVIASEIKK